ncbi:hypothetical protein AUI07_04600 [archaeon 13_2_20CM_2_53_6]|nr:MAG: hypothetical protein AUI07_04600 [archaeon 13_2_20CM_2_53_6]
MLIGLIFVPVLLVLFPLGCWRTLLVIAADRVFRLVILPPHQDVLLRRFRVPFSTQSKYFLSSPSFPNNILWRMLQTGSVVFLFASTATPLLATIRTPTIEEDWFFGLALVALCLVMPLIALLWLYEDSGVRAYNKESGTVSKVGTWIQQFVFGTGVATSFWKFTQTIQGGTIEQISLATILFLILIPPCLVVTVVFHRNLQPMFVKRFRMSSSSGFLAQRNVDFRDPENPG